MAAMWIFCVCCVCLVVLGIRVGRRRKKREEAELVNRLKDTCETYQLSCPYCDCVPYSRVKWGEKPETYTCINCGRSFTQEERENLAESWPMVRDSAQALIQDPTANAPILEDAGASLDPAQPDSQAFDPLAKVLDTVILGESA